MDFKEIFLKEHSVTRHASPVTIFCHASRVTCHDFLSRVTRHLSRFSVTRHASPVTIFCHDFHLKRGIISSDAESRTRIPTLPHPMIF